MSFVEWSEELSIGIPQTDEEHHHLVLILNELDDAKRVGKGSRVMAEILDRLVDYTVVHFQSEEKLMEEYGFPGIELHRTQHQQLVDKVARFQTRFHSRRERITNEVMDFLKYWLTNHILVDDMAFGNHVTRNPGSVPSRTGQSLDS